MCSLPRSSTWGPSSPPRDGVIRERDVCCDCKAGDAPTHALQLPPRPAPHGWSREMPATKGKQGSGRVRRVPCVAKRVLNHRATRDIPLYRFLGAGEGGTLQKITDSLSRYSHPVVLAGQPLFRPAHWVDASRRWCGPFYLAGYPCLPFHLLLRSLMKYSGSSRQKGLHGLLLSCEI